MIKYDYLIVGSGLFGSVFAHEMTKAGKKCLIMEKRNHIAGNCYSENKDGINVHSYGPHIFHTNDKGIWEWINQFTEFHNYKHTPKVNHKGKIYSFPINLMTLYQIWGVNTPEEAKQRLEEARIKNDSPKNLEEWILSQVGQDIYETFIKGYTQKQWNKDPKELPTSIIKRLPIRTNFDDNYFFDKYQGIPVGGYTQIFEKMLEGIEVKTNVDYFENKEYWNSLADKVVFTGKIDEFFDYKFGELEYRTLKCAETFTIEPILNTPIGNVIVFST
jgi:UDP-galactopyranose mutase